MPTIWCLNSKNLLTTSFILVILRIFLSSNFYGFMIINKGIIERKIKLFCTFPIFFTSNSIIKTLYRALFQKNELNSHDIRNQENDHETLPLLIYVFCTSWPRLERFKLSFINWLKCFHNTFKVQVFQEISQLIPRFIIKIQIKWEIFSTFCSNLRNAEL